MNKKRFLIKQCTAICENKHSLPINEGITMSMCDKCINTLMNYTVIYSVDLEIEEVKKYHFRACLGISKKENWK